MMLDNSNLIIFRDDEWRRITDSQKRALGLTFDNDGEFYMNFNRDFLRYFGEVEIVHKTPGKMMADQGSEIKYEVMYFQGAWDSNTAGGCGNDSIGEFLKSKFAKMYCHLCTFQATLSRTPNMCSH